MPHRFSPPWRFYAYVRDNLGIGAVISAHGCSQAQAYRYARTASLEGGERNPGDAIEALLALAVEAGGDEGKAAALAFVERMAATVGRKLAFPEVVQAEHETVAEEVADILPAVGQFAQDCLSGASREVRNRSAEAAFKEIEGANLAADKGQVFNAGRWVNARASRAKH